MGKPEKNTDAGKDTTFFSQPSKSPQRYSAWPQHTHTQTQMTRADKVPASSLSPQTPLVFLGTTSMYFTMPIQSAWRKVLIKKTTDPAFTYYSAHAAFIIYLVQRSGKGQNQTSRVITI